MVEQECNTAPCAGSWSCWSPWSRCSPGGTRTRTRDCLGPDGGAGECPTGEGREEEACGGTADTPRSNGVPEVLPAPSPAISVNMVIGGCVAGFMFGISLGALLVYYYFKYRRPPPAVASPHYISAKSQNLYVSLPMLDLKHKQLGGGGSGSSDYSGTLRSNATGTLRSKTGSSLYGGGGGGKPGEYETATIKRSHSRRDSSLINGAIRADLDSEHMFS